MKKIFYTLIASLPFFTSCEEADFGVKAADPQSWEQEEAITLPGLSLSPVATVDLANAGDSVVIINPSLSGTIPEGAKIGNFRVELVSENGSTTLNACEEGKVKTAELQTAIETAYGKRPEERTFDAIVYANIMSNGQASLIKAETTVSAIPVAPVIESAYYLVGAPNGWDWTNGDYQFSHSGKDVYDDPIFTLTFTAPVDEKTGNRVDCWFKINPKSAFEAGAETSTTLGSKTDGSTELEGTLVAKGETSCGAINMPASDGAKYYRITLNMMDYSYKVEILNHQEFIYEIGNNNGWSTTYALHSPASDGIYHGAMFLKSGFKFRSNANDWNGSGNWGLDADGTEGKLISDGGSKDIPLTEDGFYKITVDLNKMEYTLAKFEKLGIIGDGQPGGWDTDTELTYDDTEKCWKATGVELTGGKSIKLRTVGDWNPVNIGGASLDKLIFNSNDNIPVAESGTFTVKLFLETAGQPYATLTKE